MAEVQDSVYEHVLTGLGIYKGEVSIGCQYDVKDLEELPNEDIQYYDIEFTSITNGNNVLFYHPTPHIENADGTFKNGTYNKKAKVTASALNIRAGRPGSPEYNTKLGTYKKGEVIVVKYCLNNWFGVIYKGKQGFICGSYVELI